MKIWDVVVIGGGITGSGIVRDIALRGLNSLLLEKNDFASGTSSKSGKLIHGGLRYLKYFQLKLVFESCQERIRLFRTVAPHIVKPVRFYFPFYKDSHTKRWLTALGLFIYDLLSLFRNIQNFKFESSDKTFHEFSHLKKTDFIGALSYSDCACHDYRLVIDTLKSAFEAGAELKNYFEVLSITKRADQIFEITCLNKKTNKEELVLTKTIINSTGVWADDLLKMSSSTPKPFGLKYTCGIHLVFNKTDLPIADTLTLESREDHRNIYLVPWQNYVLVGTTDKIYTQNKENIPILTQHIDYLFNVLHYYLPDLKLDNSKVVSAYSGIRPLIGSETNKREEEISRDYEILIDLNGILSITGGKLTTYRLMAKHTVDKLITTFFKNKINSPCKTLSPISGGVVSHYQEIKSQFEKTGFSNHFEPLWNRYGSNSEVILNILKSDSQKSAYIQNSTYLKAEIDYIAKYEFVYTLCDVMFRRTDLYLFSNDNGRSAAKDIAPQLATAFNWNPERTNQEIDDYLKLVDFQLSSFSK